MIHPDRLQRAKVLNVLRGVPVARIAERYELPYRELEEVSKAERWDELRVHQLTALAVATDSSARAINREPDPLIRHSLVADLLVQQGHDLALALGAAADMETVKALRSRAEALRTISESCERAVKLAREARGLVQGVASAQASNDKHGVTYEIVMAPAAPSEN